MNEKPIVEMRALHFSWAEVAADGISVEKKHQWRIEVRLQDDTRWTPIKLVEVQEPPPDGPS